MLVYQPFAFPPYADPTSLTADAITADGLLTAAVALLIAPVTAAAPGIELRLGSDPVTLPRTPVIELTPGILPARSPIVPAASFRSVGLGTALATAASAAAAFSAIAVKF